MTGFVHKDRPVKWIPVKDISVIWAEAQRGFDPRKAKEIAENLDPDIFGTLTVSLPNGEGVYHCVDGQHRAAAVKLLWGEAERVPCVVVEAKTPKRAAEIFYQMNSGRTRPSAMSLYKTALTSEKEPECSVDEIVRHMGFRVQMDTAEGSIRAVTALLSIYRKQGPEILSLTLGTIKRTFGLNVDAVDAAILRGYALFFTQYKDVDVERLVRVVEKKFSPTRLIGAARSGREMHGGSIAGNIVIVLAATYNRGLRTGHLEAA